MRPSTWLLILMLAPPAHADDFLLPDQMTEAAPPKKCKNCSDARDLNKKVEVVREATSSRCDLNAVAANAVRIGAPTRSRRKCLPMVRLAFEQAGCSVPSGFRHNAVYAFRHLRGAWRCGSGGSARSAPNKSVIFSVTRPKPGCRVSSHTELKVGNCFYSDFHHPDCLPSSKYRGCDYVQIGWCQP